MAGGTRKKARISKRAQCIRKTTTTVGLTRKLMPNAPKFDASMVRPEWSAKFQALIEQIRVLDAKDMKAHGTLFKHFIFTDIRESAYGAKALASNMIAKGFDFCMKWKPKTMMRKGKLVETKTGETVYVEKDAIKHGSNRFAILQSLPLWKNPLSITTKKAILGAFNTRPDNVYGEHLRIIILDSKYKEGIDLFDVKYIHLMEPPIATSDLKQAVGRATRFCGQRGLPFVPRRGWPLEVFVYTSELPNREPFTMDEGQKVDAHDLMLRESGLDLALIHLTKELTVLAIASAVDYDLNFKINNFDIESALLDTADVDDVLVAEIGPRAPSGGAVVAIHNVADLTPAVMQKCLYRKTKLFPFSKKLMGIVARRLGLRSPPRAKREWYCKQLTAHPEYLQALLTASPDVIRKRSPATQFLDTESPASLRTIHTNNATPNMTETYAQIRRLFTTPSPSSGTYTKTPKFLARMYSLPFGEFQNAIRGIYSDYEWESPVVKSGCETTAIVATGRPVTFTRTQDFVRRYLTPESEFKGLLAWHSVGTGKTCMAVAAATTYFEQAGYTILWVTRNALMADVYKNIFGSVCSIPIMDQLEKGYELPKELDAQKRLLSHAWIQPISYRMFQNALEKKNELGRTLWANNPTDPLKKTFLVMDEIHKLRDGDLGPAESANFDVIQSFIHNSYKTSGDESVRPLLMTATPITDSPVELFDILNTLIAKPADRLMPFDTFRKSYADDTGAIRPEGRDYFQERAKGLISYLNREYDPTTFAQPTFHTIQVGIADTAAPTAGDLADRCVGALDLERPVIDDCADVQDELDNKLRRFDDFSGTVKEKKAALAALKKTYKAKLTACLRATRKAASGWEKGILKTAKKCYTAEKRLFGVVQKTSQMSALEDCFTKKKAGFVPYNTYEAEVLRRIEEPDTNFSSVGAVKTPIR